MTPNWPAVDAVVVVDPQAAFASPHGSLARAHGLDEVQPIARAFEAIAEQLRSVPPACEVVVVRSKYCAGQFCADRASALHELCVGAHDRALAAALSEVMVAREFVKTEHSAWTSPAFRRWSRDSVAGGRRHVLVCGALLEHCVSATATDCRAVWPRVSVPPDWCGSRAAKYTGSPSIVTAALDRLRARGVEVHGVDAG